MKLKIMLIIIILAFQSSAYGIENTEKNYDDFFEESHGSIVYDLNDTQTIYYNDKSLNLSNYTLSVSFVIATNDTNMILFGKSNKPIVQTKDCDIQIIPGKIYNLTAVINTSGKFVHCQEIYRGKVVNENEWTGIIDEPRFYSKPPLDIWDNFKLVIENLLKYIR